MSTETIAHDQCLAPERSVAPAGQRYGWLFEGLPPLEADESALLALGGPGGPCDLGDEVEADEASVAAGWPFFGQFIAHDISADRSPIGHRAEPAEIRNFRTPRANLEGLYGSGPVGSPYLYDKDDPAKLLLGPSGHDVPRNQQGIALVGDPRNDVHLFMNQMQVSFIRFHNLLVDHVRERGTPEEAVFDKTRHVATWHYQSVILREFLPLLIGRELTEDLLNGGAGLYRPEADPFIPFEFADAAYRYGHSQIRPAYRINQDMGPVPLFPDLIGFGEVPAEHRIDWTMLFDADGAPAAQRAKRIDGCLPQSLIALPHQVSGVDPSDTYASLATRDLQRGQTIGLPSGETVADALGVDPLTAEQIGLAEFDWTAETPLWLYVLKEAEALHDGDRLGPVGGRIVGEVLVGIIDADPESFRSVAPDWTPTLPAHEPGRFGIADILCPAATEAATRASDR